MEQQTPKHERIRFRRDEIVRLGDLPSAGEPVLAEASPRRRSRTWFVIGWCCAFLLAIVLAVPPAVYLFGIPQAAGDRLLDEAEAAFGRLVGFDVEASMGESTLSIDPSRFLGLQVNDLRLRDPARNTGIAEAGTIKFGLRFIPLLSGKVQLGSVAVSDARIDLSSLPMPKGGDWKAGLSGPDGLLDPGLVMNAAFASVHRLFDALDAGSTRRIGFTNVEIIMPPGMSSANLTIVGATLDRETEGFILKGEIRSAGRTISVDGSASRDSAQTSKPVSFDAKLSLAPTEFRRTPRGNGQFAIVGYGGAADLTLSGQEGIERPRALRLEARLDDARLAFANGTAMTGSGRLSASFRADARKIEIERAELLVGRSRFVGHGAVGPAPARVGEPAHYRYEMVSDGSTLAPDRSTEPDLTVFSRIAGGYDPGTRKLTANEIALRTSSGQANGTAIVSFVEGLSPGVELALGVPGMSVSHAKQIWPWFAAHGAKNWANEKLFGGTISDSRLALSVKPGRLGDGVPLGKAEISGYFEIQGTRFDITGQIPPVRDGTGSVSFQGTDADIRIASGTVFLPTGRTVAAKDGTFAIRRGELPPVIGSLDIAVAGSADAVAELASYKPIDAMRHLSLKPEDLTGEVTGNIKAQIPLQANVDVSRLGWAVKLSYSGLSIAKTFEGQTVQDAVGTIEVVPTQAVFKAVAKLNGMPATLDIAEPLGESDAERRRDVTLVMDGKAQDAMLPGLEQLLAGPVKVKLTGEGEVRRISADLAAAKVSVPWAGWSKGAGIPATLELDYRVAEGETRLSNIRLAGESFSLSGSAVLSRGSLASAKFDKVRLNRDDEVSIDVRRAEGGYVVSVRGNAFDARSLIKQALDPDGISGGGKGGKALQVTLEASVGSVSGFQGEKLRDVKVTYRGAGSKVLALDASGITRSGAAFTVADGTKSGSRTVRMASGDAGAILRFLDLYAHMDGGRITLDLAAQGDSPLRGQIDARDFALVDEPRLRSIVATTPQGDTRTLNEAVRGEIDTSRVRFERGAARLEKGKGYLKIDGGVLRGPAIGTTFQGSLYDANGNMAITGTFMPAYGLNRIFGEIPLLGQILGNGRDRGLIGITYKVAGNAKSPQVQVNPISVIAPGIFRSIFEFN